VRDSASGQALAKAKPIGKNMGGIQIEGTHERSIVICETDRREVRASEYARARWRLQEPCGGS
jgi:hypothetical protein